MRDRGQLSQFHEVSQDRRSWVSASHVPELFPKAASGQEAFAPSSGADEGGYLVMEGTSSSPVLPVSEAAPSWFVARGTTHQGPFYLADLQRMAGAGEIGASTLVWKSGTANWLPAHQVTELRFSESVTAPVASSDGSLRHPAQVHLNQPSAHQPSQTSGLAIASFVLGLLWLCGIGSLLATIFGAIALGQISRSNGNTTGKGLAIAGLILGILGLSALALSFTLGFLGAILDQAQRQRWGL
jgi:hypothetical protein